MRFLRPSFLCVLVLVAIAMPAPAEPFEPIRVVLVRHAEKAKAPEGDVTLKRSGWERAAALSELLEDAGVTALYSTDVRRTRLTLLPLAEKLGLPVREIPAKDPQAMAQAVLAHPGGLVVVAAHSNTLGPILQALGGPLIAEIDESDYDNLFVVTIWAPGKATMVRLRWAP